MPLYLRRRNSATLLLISLLTIALLLTGCGGNFSLDVNLDGGGDSAANGNLFLVLVVVLVVVALIVVVGRA